METTAAPKSVKSLALAAMDAVEIKVTIRPDQELRAERAMEVNEQVFLSLEDARRKLETWRVQYNCARPHSSLGYLSPAEYAQQNRQARSETAARNAWPADQVPAGALQRTAVSVKEPDRLSSSLRT